MRTKHLFLSMLLCISYWGIAQNVSGVVYLDSDDEVAIGATVRVKGTSTGAITDLNGRYSIQADADDILVASFVGYATQEKPVSGATTDFFLESSTVLDDVVVTAFGIEKDEKALGYAVQEVSSEDLNLQGQVNALEGLQGRVSGLQINRTSGSAGGGVDLLIRNLTSIDPSRNNQPLIIVDGVAVNNDTFSGDILPSAGSNATGSGEQFGFSNRAGDFNPQDIESYSILKGAAATALYGDRASNGAIVITTKRGNSKKAQIGVNLSTSFRDVVKTPELQTTFREGHRTTKIPAVNDPNSPDGYTRYAGFSFYTWGVPYTDDEFVLEDGTVIDLSNDRFYSPYDLFTTGRNTQGGFNVSGTSERFTYYFSAANSQDEGVLPNTEYDKTNFRLRGGYEISPKIKINSSLQYVKSGGNRGTGGDKSIFSSLSYWATSFDINDYLLPDGSPKNYSNGIIDNPRYYVENSTLVDDVDRWIANVAFDYSPTEWLDLRYSIQRDNYSDLRNRFVPPVLDVGTQVRGFIANNNIDYNGIESNFLATFKKDVTEKLNSKLLVGHQVVDNNRKFQYLVGEGLNVPGINEIANTSTISGSSGERQQRIVGVFGDLQFDYADKVFLSITGRNDWNSAMPKSNRSFFYPGASLAYSFGDDIDPSGKVLSYGKIRTSYAQVGKTPPPQRTGRFLVPAANFPLNGAGGYAYSSREGDLNIKPERLNGFEIGTDLRFIDNKLRLDYSYYNNDIRDQILSLPAPQSSGLSGVYRNSGRMQTWGHEFLAVGYFDFGEHFKWSPSVNFSKMKGELKSLPDDIPEVSFFSDRITSKLRVGDEIGTLYGWVFQTTPSGERYVGPDGKWVVTGSDNEGFYYTGTNEMVKVGNAMPDFVASFGNDLSWKDLSLNFLLEWKKGGQSYDRGRRNAIRNGNLKMTEFRDQTRVLEGMMDDGNGGYTANTQELLITANSYYRDFNNYNTASEILLQDSDWVKLRTIGLTYDLPNSIFGDTEIFRGLSINANANNILLWTPFDGFDPEASQFSAGSNVYGFTGLVVPLQETYSFGLNAKF